MSDRITQLLENDLHAKRLEIKKSPEYLNVQQLFSNAAMVLDVVEALESGLSPEDVREQMYDRFYDNQNRQVIDQFVDCSVRVNDTLLMANEEAMKSSTTSSLSLARGVADSRDKSFIPSETITVTNYPLAIELVTSDDKDYCRVARTRNPEKMGGEYRKNVGVNFYLSGESKHVPLIVLRKESSRNHERNHATNHQLMEAYHHSVPVVEQNDNSNVHFEPRWGAVYGFNSHAAIHDLERAMQNGVKIESVTKTKRYNWALVDAMSNIKDELLAAVGHSTSNSEAQLENVFTVVNYDTLGTYFWENDDLRTRYYKDRETMARNSTESAIKLQKFYSTSWQVVDVNDGQLWEKRQSAFRLFLAQLPLNEWPQWTGDGSLLKEEQEVFTQTLDLCVSTIDSLKITKRWKGMDLSSSENTLLNEAIHTKRRFENFVFNKSDNLIIGGLYFYEYKFKSISNSLSALNYSRVQKYSIYMDLIGQFKDIKYSVEMGLDTNMTGDIREDTDDVIEKLDVELEESSNFEEIIGKYKEVLKEVSKKWVVDYDNK